MKRIIAINGASSSGRTSLVAHLASSKSIGVRGLYFDDFVGSLPRATWARCSQTSAGWAEMGALFNQYLFDECPSDGVILADHFMLLDVVREHLFALFGREQVTYVQLYCELGELERREAQRADRKVGLTRSQFKLVYAHKGYDIRIDTTHACSATCATALIDQLAL